MKGRIFKFRLDDKTINYDMDNFLFNIVKNRDRNQIYLSKGRVKNESINVGDYIFIQSKNQITHYMRCKECGPNKNKEDIEISVKDITKLIKPIKSDYLGQGYNKLSEREVLNLL